VEGAWRLQAAGGEDEGREGVKGIPEARGGLADWRPGAAEESSEDRGPAGGEERRAGRRRGEGQRNRGTEGVRERPRGSAAGLVELQWPPPPLGLDWNRGRETSRRGGGVVLARIMVRCVGCRDGPVSSVP
jgi:hypothetical protein